VKNRHVADAPDGIVLKRSRDLEGVRRHPWPRRAILAAIALFAILALLNVFGQRPSTSSASSPEARLKLYSPAHLRGGLLFSARFHVFAKRDVKNAILVLDPGWVEGMSINTIEPSPVGEASSNGRLSLQLGHIPKGQSYILWMQFQVNPTNIAWHRSAGVTLTDGSTPLVHIPRRVTIYP
jgi:hypothetical protein